jgi:hypothetical protein
MMLEALTEGFVMSLQRFLGPITGISLAMLDHRFASTTWSSQWIKPA